MFSYQQLHFTLRSCVVKIERFPSPLARAAFVALHEERLASALAAAKATVRASIMAEAAAKAADAAKAAEAALERAQAELAAAEAAEAAARAAQTALVAIDKPRSSIRKRVSFDGPVAVSAPFDV
jgi:hypothetical protein